MLEVSDLKARRDKPWWEWDSSSKEAYCLAEAGATELEGSLQHWAQTLRKGYFLLVRSGSANARKKRGGGTGCCCQGEGPLLGDEGKEEEEVPSPLQPFNLPQCPTLAEPSRELFSAECGLKNASPGSQSRGETESLKLRDHSLVTNIYYPCCSFLKSLRFPFLAHL